MAPLERLCPHCGELNGESDIKCKSETLPIKANTNGRCPQAVGAKIDNFCTILE